MGVPIMELFRGSLVQSYHRMAETRSMGIQSVGFPAFAPTLLPDAHHEDYARKNTA